MYLLRDKEDNHIVIAVETEDKAKEQQLFYPNTNLEQDDITYTAAGGKFCTPEELEDYNKEQLYKLSLTRADVLLALYDKFGLTPEAIRAKLSERDQIRFDYAQNFYRGDESVIALATELGVSDDDLNYLFKNKSFPE